MADVTGIKPQDQVRIEQHVDLAEQYPVFQRPEWRQYNGFCPWATIR